MTTKITEKNISSIANRFVSWQSVKTSGFTAVAGEGYFCNTTSTAFTVTLPATAIAGDTITIKDYAGTFATNKLTIDRNGHNIQGAANNSLIQTNRAAITLVYIDSTRGWEYVKESNVADLGQPLFISATGGTITTSGNFKIHSFTGDGCFVVSQVGNSPVVPTGGPGNVDYLVVAGGGAGGCAYGGGGGAGGYRTTFPSPACNAGSFPISATTYPITVGGGGSVGVSGSNSIFSTITSTGGGKGGPGPGSPGGSGGGGSALGSTGGSGNTPPVSPPQGNNGGNGGGSPSPANEHGGGGGGAGGTGTNASNPTAGPGGSGSANSITGSPVTYAGGGGGGVRFAGTAGSGGTGGGGTGAVPSPAPGPAASNPLNSGTPGTANTGGGGGGGAYRDSGATEGAGSGGTGGKGIVVIRYKYQ